MSRFEVTATDLHDQLSACLNGVAYRGDRLHVVRHGRVVAVVISPDEALRLDAAADAAARQPEQEWALLTQSVKARNYCSRCEQFIERTGQPQEEVPGIAPT